MGTLSGWSYYKDITITGQSGAGTDYQVELNIGDSAGGDFHLEGHCTNFPQDIRITDNDGTTLLDHFVLDLTADPITVKVEVKDNLDSDQTIRVYYGKSGETTDSNGANTFLQYHGAATADFLDALVVSPASVVYEAKIKRIGTSNTLWGLADTDFMETNRLYVQSYTTGDRRYVGVSNSGSHSYIFESPQFANGVWVKAKITCNGSVVYGYIDDNEISSGGVSTNIPTATLGLGFREASGSAEQLWSFARKYNSLEPAFSSAGAEQTISAGWSDKIIGVSSPGKVNGILATDISKILGVA